MYLHEDRDDVAFLTTGSGSSESGRLYSKRDLYERGHVAVCSHKQAICITVFVFSSIFLTSLAIAFARPWNDCGSPDLLEDVAPEVPKIPIASNGEEFPWDDVRLPIFVRPVSYDLELTPNLTTLAVKGIIKLIFKVTEETDFIIFHAKNINITSKTINEKLRVKRLLEFREREQIYLETDKPMKPSKTFSVRLKFEYNLSQELEGFYLSTYTTKEGETRRLATTHFEPTYARAAFPCFDEPQLKAVFTLTITHDRDLTAYFNMPLRESSKVRGKPGRVRDEFVTTEKMSSYLLAFVICDFHNKSAVTQTNNITVSVLAAKDKISQADFALQTAVKVTDHYEQYFGIKYPLPKQDLIAIPDFAAGAMENWGLITYRETALLYRENCSSSSAKQWVAIVVAHELAHQWFGNLVTMRWWNDLWLNEGFASWMEYKGVAHSQPNWRMMDQFWAHTVMAALKLDALVTSHPVSVSVTDPKEIEAIFDTISYKKGSAIIHMLERFLGEDVLRRGLALYLAAHKFGSAATRDLWRSLSAATEHSVDVEQMMNTWTLQTGYPLISFERAANSPTGWCVKQARFFSSSNTSSASSVSSVSSSVSSSSKYNGTWFVPVDYMTDISVTPHRILLNATQNASNGYVEIPAEAKWIKANVNGSGYYRVQYPPDTWDQLVLQLKTNHSVFSPVDRAQLIDDAFSLCRAGLLPHTVPLHLVSYLPADEDLVPWLAGLTHLARWRDLLRETKARELLDKFILSLLGPIMERLTMEDKGDHVTRLLRQRVLWAAIDAEHPAAVKQALSMFRKMVVDGEAVPPNLQEVVFRLGIRKGVHEDWDWAWNRSVTTNVPTEKKNLLRALGDSGDVFRLQRYLDMALNKTLIRTQDVNTVLSSVAFNPAGNLLAWRHLQRNWDLIFERFHSGSFTMGHIIKAVVSHFSSQFDYQQVLNFFDNREVGAGQRVLDQSLEEIRGNIRFRELHQDKIIAWLRGNSR